MIIGMNFVIWGVNVFTDMIHLWWQFGVIDNNNNNDTCHSKLFDLFNNKSKILLLLRRTISFSESYSDPEDTSAILFDGKNGV